MSDNPYGSRPEQGPAGPSEPGQPSYGPPSSDSSPYGQPSYGQPEQGQPTYGQPAYGQPSYDQPTYGQNAYGQPGSPSSPAAYGQPSYGQPPYGQPGGGYGAPSAPSSGQGGGTGFLGSLFDFSFTSFVTPKIIKGLYLLVTVLVGLGYLFAVIGSFVRSPITGLLVLVVGGVVAVVYVALARVVLEFYMAFFRMADDVQELKKSSTPS